MARVALQVTPDGLLVLEIVLSRRSLLSLLVKSRTPGSRAELRVADASAGIAAAPAHGARRPREVDRQPAVGLGDRRRDGQRHVAAHAVAVHRRLRGVDVVGDLLERLERLPLAVGEDPLHALRVDLEAVAGDEGLDALGAHVYERFLEAKTMEWDQYRMDVSPWEIARYLEEF